MIGNLVLIGEAPGGTLSIAHRPALALTGRAGRAICDLAGWDWTTYLRRTERHNLFLDPMPDGRWPRRLAAVRARQLALRLEGRTIILLGAKVAEAFDLAEEPLYSWLYWATDWANVAKIPHPSGRNRMWNDPAEKARARAFLEGLLA